MNKLILLLTLATTASANFVDTNVKKLKWGDLEVVWVKDDKFPTYDLNIYFDDGAMTEKKSESGVTQFMFNELTSGTTRYGQKEILSSLEFYGTSFAANVTHEFSTYSLSGLSRDLNKNLKMVCHLFSEATFPESEIKKSKRRALSSLKNLVTDHQSLASRVFRELSLKGTPYARAVDGYINTIKNFNSSNLSNRLAYMNKVKKRIYIRGPESVLSIESIINNDCNWTKSQDFKKDTIISSKDKSKTDLIYLVSVPKSNQAQIRIGKILTQKEVQNNPVELSFASKYLGGGFTSRLMQEVRVKRGLTYSIGAYASGQRMYGRSGISTFTKNQTLAQTLKVIDETINSSTKSIPTELFNHSLRFIKGNYLLGLESTSEFMSTLMYLDHQNRSYSEIYDFKKEVDQITPANLSKRIDSVFGMKNQITLVLGDSNLRSQLIKAGFKVKRLNYKDFL